MCTVTIIPLENDSFVLTSNRDEAPNRIPLTPEFYLNKNIKMLYPKDKKAGGTWIGVSEKNRLICLLNGAFKIHERKESYRLSRGVVVRDFLASEDIVLEIKDYNLQDVEPFTLVVADWNSKLQFYELVWDGTQKHFSKLEMQDHIWSSSTLYSHEMKQKRKQWFEEFKDKNELTPEKMLEFHKTTQVNNTDYGIVMDRGFVKTTSVTQVLKVNDVVSMNFDNLQNKTKTTTTFLFPETIHE